MPHELDPVAAAALPLAGLTAWQVLVGTADVQPGQRVLVHAAAGGVGHLAVQIAKALGAHVIGTARAGRHETLLGLGADQVVDYSTTRFEDVVENVDVVVDLVGGQYADRSLRTIRTGGLLVSVPGGTTTEHAAMARQYGVRTTGILVEPDGAALSALARLVEEGRLRPLVEDTFPLGDAGKAHLVGEIGRGAGEAGADHVTGEEFALHAMFDQLRRSSAAVAVPTSVRAAS